MHLLAQAYRVGTGTRDLTGLALIGGVALVAFGGLELLLGHGYWFGVGDRDAFGPIHLRRSDGARFYAACGVKIVLGLVALAWWQLQR